MSKFNKDTEKHLLQLLNKELKLLATMKEHVIKQKDLLASDKIEELAEDLDSSEKLKVEINGLHQEAEPLMQSYISVVAAGEYGRVKSIAELRDKLRKIMAECKEQNDKNHAEAGNKIDEYKARIKELDTSKKTFGAYSVTLPDNSEHFDKTT